MVCKLTFLIGVSNNRKAGGGGYGGGAGGGYSAGGGYGKPIQNQLTGNVVLTK